MGALEERVAIITGAGRGLGREHALLFASEGASVVVNDVGVDLAGGSQDSSAAEQVVAEIIAAGGKAVANHDDVTDQNGAARLIDQAVEEFGDLHVLVNNAGILRDRVLVNMDEADWDDVVRVHLKGHFAPTRQAARYWRQKAKSGDKVAASVVYTSSTSGLLGQPGQTNYGAAKSGVATFAIISDMELRRYGVRCNAIAPVARTRMTESIPGASDRIGPPEDGCFDEWSPANISPLVAYLATESCAVHGQVFFVKGRQIARFEPWKLAESIQATDRWTVEGIAAAIGGLGFENTD